MPIGIIASLNHEARGITRQDGKAIFVDGALPGEVVEYASFRKKSKFELATLERQSRGAMSAFWRLRWLCHAAHGSIRSGRCQAACA